MKEAYIMNEKLIYENALSTKEDIKDFVLEGKAIIDFVDESMQLKNALANEEGQKANYVLWCPEDFPENIKIEWEFKPLSNDGLCIMFFGATGQGGVDLFDKNLKKRTGEYPQYHSSDINAFHVSYFRRKEQDEKSFHTCNLRKSSGFHLVAQGADPIPCSYHINDFYKITVTKKDKWIKFYVNDLCVFTYEDDGITYGERLYGGKIGFRQLAPLTAQYKNLKVFEI